MIGRAETLAFLAEKPVSMIWGVGKVMRQKLEQDGIANIGQLQTMTEVDLARRYGKMGSHLFHLARGQDNRKVDPDGETKSISAETTFDTDIADFEELSKELWPLCEKVSEPAQGRGVLRPCRAFEAEDRGLQAGLAPGAALDPRPSSPKASTAPPRCC